MNNAPWVRNALAASLALALSACGGGGGTKTTPPVAPPPTTPPPSTPSTPQPAMDAHLALTNAQAAQAAGFNGAGIRIGIVDSGVMRNHPALAGRVLANYSYIDPRRNNLSIDDVVGHGTAVAQLAAGAATGSWPGGVAPGAQIVSARIINDERPKDDGSGQGNEVTGALGMAPVHQDLINAGARIMNNSWGGLYWTRTTATAPIADEYRPFIIGHGGLVVFATGNEGRATPTDMASLPSKAGPNGTLPAADLERGWLAVAALDTANPSQLASYSNACGVARNYCLVAPGTAAYVGANATAGNLSYYYNSGTSFAAPLVSGAAALVWQAFPYFDNDLVRQTLLGTATDLGEPGADAVFGYGLLNVGKAVRGPAKFDWGNVTVNLDGNSTWSNAISGSGGLVKRGNGTLTLGHAGLHLDYTGDTRIQQGTLVLAGDLRQSDVFVESGGRLAGTAWMGADLRNAGVVEVDTAGAAQGGMRVDGDYLQQAGGRLALTLGNGQLQVKGAATLQGGDVHVLGVRQGYVTQAREYVLAADGGLSGRFDALTSAPSVFLQATLGYSGTQAWMDIDRINVTAAARSIAGITPAALGAATRVEQAFQRIDAQQGRGEGAIAEGFIRAAAAIQHTAGQQAAAATLRSLSGEAHAAATAMTFDSIDMNRRALSAQFGDEPPGSGAWARSLGEGGQGGYAGSDYRLGGWMLGNEAGIDAARVGFAFGQTRASVAGGVAQDRGRDQQTQAQFYAGQHWGRGYTLGQAGFGQYRRELDRGLLLGGERAGVMAQYDGRFLSGGVEAGYRFGTATASLTPYLGANHVRIDSEAFAEQGGYGFGLSAGHWHASRTQALAGMRGGYQWRGLALNGYAEWQQVVGGEGAMPQARFTGVDVWTPLQGMSAGSSGLFGLSVDAWLSRSARLSLGYDQRFGGRGDDNRQVSLRFLQAF